MALNFLQVRLRLRVPCPPEGLAGHGGEPRAGSGGARRDSRSTQVARSGRCTSSSPAGYASCATVPSSRTCAWRATSSASGRCFGTSRAPRARRPTRVHAARFPTGLFRRLLDEHPDFRLRLEQRPAVRLPPRCQRSRSTSPRSCCRRRADRSPAHRRAGARAGRRSRQTPPPPQRRRFPHVYQLDEMDCGAACLAMICRHFGRAVGTRHIRQLVHTSTDGTTLAGHRARRRGARPRRALGRRRRRAGSTTCRCRPSCTGRATTGWSLYGVDDEHVRVADPARGLRRIPREEFAGALERLHGARRLHAGAWPTRRRRGRASPGWAVPAPAPAAAPVRSGSRSWRRRSSCVLPILTQVDRRPRPRRAATSSLLCGPAGMIARAAGDHRARPSSSATCSPRSRSASTRRRSTSSPAGCSRCR